MAAKRTLAVSAEYAIHPVTPERWPDLEALFGPHGACAGCWCMWWRLSRAQFGEQARGGGAANHEALKAIVDSGQVPGLLAYAGDTPVGWCAIAPRATYPTLQRSTVLGPVDDKPVWSIACFYIHRKHRRQGLTRALIDAALRYAAGQGARLVEAYPVEPPTEKIASGSAFTGLASTFRDAGFVEVARRSPTRPIMRRAVRRRRGRKAQGE
jgi:GNAT superfamily N-acetyltransferase